MVCLRTGALDFLMLKLCSVSKGQKATGKDFQGSPNMALGREENPGHHMMGEEGTNGRASQREGFTSISCWPKAGAILMSPVRQRLGQS